MAWFRRVSEQLPKIPDGRVTGGLLCGIAGAGVVLACVSPILLAAGIAAVAIATATVAITQHRKSPLDEEPTESWEERATRIGAFFVALEAEPSAGQGKFQTMVLGQEWVSRCRLH
jgi:hypothetical protein